MLTKIIKRGDGSQRRINVSLILTTIGNPRWHVSVYAKVKRGRKWTYCHDQDDFAWRRLGVLGRNHAKLQEFTRYVTREEILAAVTEAWESMKPAMADLFPIESEVTQ